MITSQSEGQFTKPPWSRSQERKRSQIGLSSQPISHTFSSAHEPRKFALSPLGHWPTSPTRPEFFSQGLSVSHVKLTRTFLKPDQIKGYSGMAGASMFSESQRADLHTHKNDRHFKLQEMMKIFEFSSLFSKLKKPILRTM